jgi:HipA-like protein
LAVWLHGVHVADLAAAKARWRIECRYTAEALERWPGNVPLLSCSLPLSARRLDAGVFCAGLLPDGHHRGLR